MHESSMSEALVSVTTTDSARTDMTDSWRTTLAKIQLTLQSRDLTDAEHIRYNDALRKRAAEIIRTRADRPKTQTWPL